MNSFKSEIRQWNTLGKKYGNHSNNIHQSNDSWILMPLIVIACERMGLNLPDIKQVPSEQKKFWEEQFLTEILEIEERIKENARTMLNS